MIIKNLFTFIRNKRNSNMYFWKVLFYLKDLNVLHVLYTHLYNPKFFNIDSKEFESLKVEFAKKRKEGVSGFVRLYNEEETIKNVILSCINSVDELVICLNNCTDGTEKIIINLMKTYKNKIKLYYYNYDIFPISSKGHINSKIDNPRNLANFYNYTLSKCSYKHVIKIDGDDLMTEDFNKMCGKIRKNGNEEYIGVFGINLYKYKGKIYFFGNELLTGGQDRGFFKIDKYTYHRKNKLFEIFKFSKKFRQFKKVLYFHLKFVKKDMGMSNRSLSKKKIILTKYLKEEYRNKVNRTFQELNLLTLSHLIEKYPKFKNLKLPKKYKIEK